MSEANNIKKRNIYIFVGTTAELIKLAPVLRQLQNSKTKYSVISTGQSDILFDELKPLINKINVSYQCTPKTGGSSVFKFLQWTIRTFFCLLFGLRKEFSGLNKDNSLFIVHGDTVSSLMGALIASVYRLKLVHIESGLRSFNLLEPFPEEICRYLISHMADIHFCPNEWCVRNLSSARGLKINTIQNTLIDTYSSVIKRPVENPIVKSILVSGEEYWIMVVHRQEHVIMNKRNTLNTINRIFEIVPTNLRCVFIAHDVSASLLDSLNKTVPARVLKNILRVPRLPYVDFMHLISKSEFMVTDGGSNQEELYYMGKPCLILRNHTERIEGLNENAVLSKHNIGIISQFIRNYESYMRKPVVAARKPSKIIIDTLKKV